VPLVATIDSGKAARRLFQPSGDLDRVEDLFKQARIGYVEPADVKSRMPPLCVHRADVGWGLQECG
jgi:hypothetical protein